MSNGTNRNDDIQDYFDLLKNDTSSEPEKSTQEKKNEKISSKKINEEAFNDVVDEDFFNDFDIKKESQGDIGRFFENSEKSAPKKPSPPPMPNKKPAPPPMVKKEKFIKVEAPAPEKVEEKIISEVKTPTVIEKTEVVQVKEQPVAEKAPAVEVKAPPVAEKTAVVKENSLLEAIKNKETEKKPTTFSDDYFKLFEGSSSEENLKPEVKKEESKKPETDEKLKLGAEIIPENDEKMIKKEEKDDKKEKNPFKKLALWFKALPKKKKIAVSIIAAFLAIVIAFVGAAGIFVMQKFSLIGDNTGIVEDGDDVVYEDEDVGDIEIDIGSADFKQSLIDWATTGNDKHMKSKNVINVLLIGADSRKGKNEGNTDVMMLVSVNKKTKTLKMISFLRDSYLYIEGDKTSYCTKLNAAYSMGGPDCLIKTLENNYKIEIDNYVMVNFKSFEKIIDAMGGIAVDVQEYEADYIQNRFNLSSMPAGDGVTLNGKQALGFCRARGCDSDGDVSRTRRQRQVIDSMVNRVMNSSISEINKYIDVLLPYVDTGYSEAQIISLGLKAITNGWAKYERNQLSMPSPECRDSGNANMWIWVVDYQKAAYELQMELYGESNIVLGENRVSIIDVYKGATYSGSSTSIKDNNNNEAEVPDTTEKVTKVPLTTEKNNNEEKTTVEETLNNVPSTEVITTQPIEDIPDEPQTEEETQNIPDEPVNGEDEPQTEDSQNE